MDNRNEILDDVSLIPNKETEFNKTLYNARKSFFFIISPLFLLSILLYSISREPKLVVLMLPLTLGLTLFVSTIQPRLVYFVKENDKFLVLFVLNIWGNSNEIKINQSSIRKKTIKIHLRTYVFLDVYSGVYAKKSYSLKGHFAIEELSKTA